MRVTFIWVGKTRNLHWAALEKDYLARLENFTRCRLCIVREAKGSRRPGQPRTFLEKEGNAILKMLGTQAYIVLLDERGTLLSSMELAKFLEQRQLSGIKEMMFIIGGATGVTPQVHQRADLKLALSTMTLPHEMARVVLLEQLYRSFAIIHRYPYHK